MDVGRRCLRATIFDAGGTARVSCTDLFIDAASLMRGGDGEPTGSRAEGSSGGEQGRLARGAGSWTGAEGVARLARREAGQRLRARGGERGSILSR